MAGPQCCVPSPPSQHLCSGSEEVLGPRLCYLVPPPSPSSSAVILFSDIFGFEAPNLRKLADKIAGAGYFVAVPDCFNKDTFIPGASPLGDWLKNHHPVDFLEDARKLVDTLKTKGFSSVGAAGFCWGAKVVVDLAKNDFLKAAVLCHPSLVTVEDISAVKTPLAVLAAEIDQMTPPELAKQFSEILESNKEVESFFHLYPGVAHGWTVRYDVNDESAVIRAEEAHCKMMEWFGKFLH